MKMREINIISVETNTMSESGDYIGRNLSACAKCRLVNGGSPCEFSSNFDKKLCQSLIGAIRYPVVWARI